MISRAKNVLPCLAFILIATPAFAPLGCGSSLKSGANGQRGEADGDVPEEVALQIRTCAAVYRMQLRPADQSISFDVKLSRDGEVDSVTLRDSTLADELLENCMAKAVRKLSEDQLTLHLSRHGRRGEFTPERSKFLGQEEVMLCLSSPPCLLTLGFLIGATYIAVQIYVHAASKPKPKPQATPKDECIDLYVKCTDSTPTAPCGDCIHFCVTNKQWPYDMCPL